MRGTDRLTNYRAACQPATSHCLGHSHYREAVIDKEGQVVLG
jgi:hypothetical protein